MNNQLPTDSSQLDPKVLKVMHALRTVESSGSKDPYNAVGDNGESHGAYQFNKGNFKSWAGQYLGDENAPMTPDNQNKVMYLRIKKQKDVEKLSPDEIAAIHNGASKDSSGRYIYNAPEYGVKFRKALMGETSQDNSSAGGSGLDRLRKIAKGGSESTSNNESNQDPSSPGHFLSNLNKGDYGNALGSGLRDIGSALTFGGSEQLAKGISSPLAAAKEKIKGLFGGQDNSKYVAPQTEEEKSQMVKGALKSLGSIGLLGATGLGSGALAASRAAVLESPAVADNIAIPMNEFLQYSKPTQLNYLKDALETAKKAKSALSTGQIEGIEKAINYLSPSKGVTKGLLKKGISMAKNIALTKMLGDSAGGLIHELTGK